jgi:hypothetical protein
VYCTKVLPSLFAVEVAWLCDLAADKRMEIVISDLMSRYVAQVQAISNIGDSATVKVFRMHNEKAEITFGNGGGSSWRRGSKLRPAGTIEAGWLADYGNQPNVRTL